MKNSSLNSNCLFGFNKYFINVLSTDIHELIEYQERINKLSGDNTLSRDNSLFNQIYNIVSSKLDGHTAFNFISIGSASNLDSKCYNIIPDKNNHQLPPFIVDLIDNNPDKDYNVFLIDERLENPPYIINNSKYIFKKSINQDNIKYNCWKSNNVTVYAFNYNIYNYKNELEGCKKLIKYIKHPGYLIINDYSGLELDRIFEYELY